MMMNNNKTQIYMHRCSVNQYFESFMFVSIVCRYVSIAGEEWRKMTTAQKAPYEQRAEEERRKYEVKMKDYNMVSNF